MNMAGYAPLHLLLVFMLLAAPLQPLLASPDSGHSTASHASATHGESAGGEQAHPGDNNPCNGAGHACGMCGTHCSALAPALYSPSANTLPESPATSPLTLIGIDLPLLYKPPRSA